MYAKAGQVVTLIAQFVASGAAATGLTVTAKVWEIASDGSKTPNNTVGTDAAVSEIGGGVYRVMHTMAADGVPLCVFSTAGTADQTDIATSAFSLADLAEDADLGTDTCTLTIRNAGGTAAIADAQVYVSTDAAGTNRSRVKTTDSLGQVKFDLTAGETYYLWVTHDDWTGTNPTSFIAAAD